MTTTDRPCSRCKRITSQEVSRRISANGAEHYGWWCLECRWWTQGKNGGMWITVEVLTNAGVDLSTIRTVEIMEAPRCSRCGMRGAELHHWAPRAIFGKDADRWPQDYLCKSCHDEWHRLVTPQLTRKQA